MKEEGIEKGRKKRGNDNEKSGENKGKKKGRR